MLNKFVSNNILILSSFSVILIFLFYSFFYASVIRTVEEVSGQNWKVGSIERQQFYEETKQAYCVVSTSETRPFGCFIFTKGVIKPDGNVWII